MGIETSLPNRKNKKISELPKETDTRSKKNRRRQKKSTMVQRLFDACKDVFASAETGLIPPQEDIERLRSVLDGMKPEDLGLNPEMPHFKVKANEGIPKITYLHLYECDRFSMGIFCLPPSGVIPLHNHPGMTVFSKLLFGTMHIKSYDWAADLPCSSTTQVVPSQCQASEGRRLARIKVDSNLEAPCNTSILYPNSGGNMHCFTAVTACAVLDVLGPPYSDPDGRHCTYYLNFPYVNPQVDGASGVAEEDKDKDGYAWLEEREKPDEFAVVGAPYRGPKIVEK